MDFRIPIFESDSGKTFDINLRTINSSSIFLTSNTITMDDNMDINLRGNIGECTSKVRESIKSVREIFSC